jgi:hypothetical protein
MQGHHLVYIMNYDVYLPRSRLVWKARPLGVGLANYYYPRKPSGDKKMSVDSEWQWPPGMDAVLAAPESHKVLFENENVRVLEVVIPVGEREPEHTHRWPSVMIVDRSAMIRYYQGAVIAFSSSPGASARPTIGQWMEPEGPHSVENVDTVPYHAFRVELKEA